MSHPSPACFLHLTTQKIPSPCASPAGAYQHYQNPNNRPEIEETSRTSSCKAPSSPEQHTTPHPKSPCLATHPFFGHRGATHHQTPKAVTLTHHAQTHTAQELHTKSFSCPAASPALPHQAHEPQLHISAPPALRALPLLFLGTDPSIPIPWLIPVPVGQGKDPDTGSGRVLCYFLNCQGCCGSTRGSAGG